jgi:hypothetical protein
MPITYEPIATTTLGSAASSVTFSSISGSYTDLVLVIRTQVSATTAYINLQFNNDTASNYSCTRIYGNGSTVASDRFSSRPEIDAGFMPGADGNGQGTIIANVMNYSNATTYKTSLIRWETEQGASGSKYTVAEVGLWRSTAAITTINLSVNGGTNFNSGSTFTLYGIKSA